MKTIVPTFLFLLLLTSVKAQVGIGTTNPNATLDIRSSNQATPSNTDGILIPKADDFPTTNPTATQDGMLLYITGNSTPTKGFYYWDNSTSNWVSVVGVQRIDDLIDGKSDSDGTNDGSSIFLGIGAGIIDDRSDNRNIGVGFNSLSNNTSGFRNIAIGYNSMLLNTNGTRNTALGYFSLEENTVGGFNTAIGYRSLQDNISGDSNSALGYYSLENITSGSNNTAVGSRALENNISGSNNVAIGRTAGANEVGSNKLYIENSNADSNGALIYGEFDTNILRTNSEFQIGNPTVTGYAFPATDGTINQVLQTDGNGALNWVDNTSIGVQRINDLADGKSDNDGSNDGSSIFLGIGAGANDNSSNNSNIGLGFRALQNNTSGRGNVAVGYDVMYSNTVGFDNTVNGYRALYLNTTGYQNTAVGYASLYSNTTGYQNTANGYYSLFSNTTGWYNTANGYESLFSNTTGTLNTAVGQESLFSNTTGSYNLASGYEALYSNVVGSGNVALGYRAGYNETGSNTLYIENTDTNPNTSLIYGEFGSDNTTTGNVLRTNSTFQIGNPASTGYAFPTVDGATNQVLQTDGNGVLTWVNSSSFADNLGNHTATTNLNLSTNNVIGVNYVSTRPISSYDKLRVWNSGNFTIGLHDAMTYGFLNDYAMSFTMNEDTDRGWIWRDSNDAQNDGAMSLTTDGKLTLKSDLRADTNTLVVDATNNRIGISTTTPASSLHINHTNGAATEGITITNQADADAWRIYQQWSSNTLALFFNNTNVGNFDDVSGTYTPVSDRRLKTAINPFGDVLDRIKDLEIVNYRFKHQQDDRNYVGLIAQDVEEVFPHLVYKNEPEEDDQLTMDYSGFGVLAVKAIQEQQQIIDKQQEEINELKKEIELIKSLIKTN